MQSKCTIWAVSPTQTQAKTFSKQIIKALTNSGFVKNNTNSSGDIKIELLNGTLIEFKSSQAKDNLRGATLDYLVLDECAFIDTQVIDEILLPMLITRPNAKVLLVSTPKGKQNAFYRFYTKGIQGEKGYASFKFTYRDTNFSNVDLIETYKLTLAEAIYLQEIEAEFIDSASVFGNINNLCTLQPQETKDELWLGIDCGLKNDYFVISALNKEGKQIFMERFTNIEVPEIIERLKVIFNKYNVRYALLENNGMGEPIFQLANREIGGKIGRFYTSNESKQEIINNMIAAAQTKAIELLDNENLKTELADFGVKINSTGSLRYGAMVGHDDCVMATAIALECLNKHQFNAQDALKAIIF